MNDRQFDAIIRKALTSQDVAFNPAHWNLLEVKLDMDAILSEQLSENQMDSLAFASLAEMEVPFDPSSWEKMEEVLDNDPSVTGALTDRALDALAVSALFNAETPYNEEHWNHMEQALNMDAQLNDASLSDTQLDQTAFEKLGNAEVPYIPGNWDKMSNKLDNELNLPTTVVRHKAVEIALLVLALFTLVHFLYQSPNPVPVEELTKDQPSIAQKADKDIDQSLIDLSTSETEIQFENSSLIDNQSLAAEKQNTSESSVRNNSNLSGNLNEIGIVSINSNLTRNSIVDNGSIAGETPIASAFDAAVITRDFNLMSRLSSLNRNESFVVADEDKTPNISILAKASIAKSNKSFRLGMVAAPDINRIFTPANIDFDTEEYHQTAAGYSFGILAISEWGKWGLETGALYSKKSYTPQTKIDIIGGSTITGFIGDGIVNAELDALSIPLNIQRDLDNLAKWDIYVSTGISANAVLTQNYDVKRFYCIGCQDGQTSSPGGGTSANPLPEITKTKGLLEGGSMKDNLYFTYNLGIGVERHLYDGTSLFVAPTYQRHFGNSIGPDRDKISTLSIFAGAKVSF